MRRFSRLITRWVMAEPERSTVERSSTTGLPTKKPGERGKRCVDVLQPFHDRHDRGKHEREVGAASQTDQLAGGLNI